MFSLAFDPVLYILFVQGYLGHADGGIEGLCDDAFTPSWLDLTNTRSG
jgi:hypothetical protein